MGELHTLPMLQEQMAKSLDELVMFAGNQSHLAKMLNIPQTTVSGWCLRKRISKEGARKVEEHLLLGQAFKSTDLRPDLAEVCLHGDN